MLRLGADFEEYRAHYTLSKRDYYGILRIEHDATAALIEAAVNQLAQFLKSEIDKGDARAEAYMREAHKAREVLTDPVRRAHYDEDLHIKAFHLSGERSIGQLSEETRLDELRTWSYHEAERQRAKERAERRARGREASEEDWEGADADSAEHRRRQTVDAESAKHSQQAEEERVQAVRAEKERRAADERSRKRQIDEFVEAKLAAEARKVQAEADLRVLLEERRKAKEVDEARVEQRNLKGSDKRKRKRK